MSETTIHVLPGKNMFKILFEVHNLKYIPHKA